MNPASCPDLDAISDHSVGTDADPISQLGVILDDRTSMDAACRDQRRMKQAGRFDMHVEGILGKNQIPRSRFVV